MLLRRWIIGLIACAISTGALSACQTGPIVPTVAPVDTLLPTRSITPEPSAPVVAVSPTWTPHPAQTAKPATPAPRSPTPNPAAQTANAPISVSNDGGVLLLNITEAQLNAALKRKFDSTPLAKYTTAPRVTLGDGALVLTLLIVPQNAPSGSSPQTMTLVADLVTVDGTLELQPTDLSPLDV